MRLFPEATKFAPFTVDGQPGELLTRDACYIRLQGGRLRDGKRPSDERWEREIEREEDEKDENLASSSRATRTRLAPMKNSRRR